MIPAVLGSFYAALALAANPVTGKWMVTFESQGGPPIEVAMQLDQSGEVATGKIQGPDADVPMTGTIKGDALELRYSVDLGSGPVAVKLNGTVDDKTINGTGDYGALGSGKFSAKRI